jgi:hypothetical protein
VLPQARGTHHGPRQGPVGCCPGLQRHAALQVVRVLAVRLHVSFWCYTMHAIWRYIASSKACAGGQMATHSHTCRANRASSHNDMAVDRHALPAATRAQCMDAHEIAVQLTLSRQPAVLKECRTHPIPPANGVCAPGCIGWGHHTCRCSASGGNVIHMAMHGENAQ